VTAELMAVRCGNEAAVYLVSCLSPTPVVQLTVVHRGGMSGSVGWHSCNWLFPPFKHSSA